VLFVANFYPDKINALFSAPRAAGKVLKTNAVGAGASFVCGSFVRFFLEIDVQTKEIREARYKTNGCGFMIAAAEVLTEKIGGRRLTELHGLNHAELFDRIETELNRRQQAGKQSALIAMHSFTPVFKGGARPWHAGVLYNRDRRFAEILLALMKSEEGLIVGDNEPYSVDDLTDYTIPVHGEGRGLLHAEIEIRQDLINDARGRQAWGARFARWLPQALLKATQKL